MRTIITWRKPEKIPDEDVTVIVDTGEGLHTGKVRYSMIDTETGEHVTDVMTSERTHVRWRHVERWARWPEDVSGSGQPAPTGGERRVGPVLGQHLYEWGIEALKELVDERVDVGREKYGTTLHTNNGRDPVQDAREELGDAAQYIAQAKMEGRDVSGLLELYEQLAVVFSMEDNQ